jgi:hypothetical protein
MSSPAGPLSVLMGPKRPRPVLLSVRAAAAWHHFQTLDFLTHGFVKCGVGQEDQPVGAGVGVMVLASFAWTKYARLCGVHSDSSFLWAGLWGVPPPAEPFFYPTLSSPTNGRYARSANFACTELPEVRRVRGKGGSLLTLRPFRTWLVGHLPKFAKRSEDMATWQMRRATQMPYLSLRGRQESRER